MLGGLQQRNGEREIDRMIAHPDCFQGEILFIRRGCQSLQPLSKLERAPIDNSRGWNVGLRSRRRVGIISREIANQRHEQQDGQSDQRKLVSKLHRVAVGGGWFIRN